MAGTYTLDASVLINAFNPYEDGHEASNRLLSRLQEQAAPLIEPVLLLPEVAAAIRRGRGDAVLARQFALNLERLPHTIFIPLDEILARQAVEAAAEYSLRGSDAVYSAVALRFSSTLVTLDKEQSERLASALPVCSPAEALKRLT